MATQRMTAADVIKRINQIRNRINNMETAQNGWLFELYCNTQQEWDQLCELIGTSGPLQDQCRFSVIDDTLALQLKLTYIDV